MKIQTTSTFEQFLQAEIINAEKNKSYYQQYDGKLLRAFHKQARIKQQIYDNMLARQSGMDYSQGIQFETSIINMEEAQELTMNNQPEKEKKTFPVWLHQALTSYFKWLLCWTCIEKGQKIGLGMALAKSEAKKAAEDAVAE